jgi:hypothetical protein
MSDTPLDELGPVDYVIVEFPKGQANFTGEMAEELIKLVDAGTIRVVDILILVKDDDGTIEAMELSDLDDLGPLEVLEAEMAELLAEEDVVNLAAAMDPGSTAGVLIYENVWAAPFASAARRSGGQLIANGRIPIQAIAAAIAADEALETEEA